MGEEGAGFRYREDLKAWWPDYDHAPERCMDFVRHGLPAIDAAVRYVKKRRWVVQAGGHAGFWPKRLAELFEAVVTFEPEPILFRCLRLNCTAPNVQAYPMGLGAQPGRVRFKSHVSAGSWRVDPAGETEIPITTVDALGLKRLDALLLDIEGYEVEALEGAAQTITRHRPVILCELLPRSKVAIAQWLSFAGYELVERFGRDGIFTYRGK